MATEKIELTKEGEAKLTKELRHLIDIDQSKIGRASCRERV